MSGFYVPGIGPVQFMQSDPGQFSGFPPAPFNYNLPFIQPLKTEVELAPIVSRFDNGAVFEGSGNSHFTFEKDKGTYHETTEIGGLRQGRKISTRFDINNPDR